jgi:hypothetical protein
MGLTPEELAERIKQEFTQAYGDHRHKIYDTLASFELAAVTVALPELLNIFAANEARTAKSYAEKYGPSEDPSSPQQTHARIAKFYEQLGDQFANIIGDFPVQLDAAQNPCTAQALKSPDPNSSG